jgi:hypothetical protein
MRNLLLIVPVFLVAFAFALQPRQALAAPASPAAGCSEAAAAWVEEAAAQAQIAVTLVECGVGREQVQLRAPAREGAVMRVEIREVPPPAFREAHGLGLSPLLEVDDFQRDVPTPLRESFDRLATWVEGHADDVRASLGPRPLVADTAGPPSFAAREWLLLALGLALAAGAGFRRRRSRGSDAATAALLFAGALSLRLALGSWGPLHPNGQGTLWLLGALRNPEELSAYGPGYPELFHPFGLLAPSSPDEAIFAANAVFSALLAPLLFAVGRVAGASQPACLLAAVVASVDGACIRMAATETYFPVLVTLSLGCALAAMRAVDLVHQRRRGRAAFVVAGGALLAVAAARIHPVAWPALAVAPAACAAVGAAPARTRALGALAAAAASAVAVVLLYPGLWLVMHQIASGNLVSPHHVSFATSDLVLIALLGAAAALGARPRGLAVPACVSLGVLLATHPMYGQHPVWHAIYERLFLAFPLLACAAILARVELTPRRWAAATAGVGAACFLTGLATVRSRTTEHDELRAVRPWIAAMPAGCRAYYVARAGRRIDVLPEYLAGPSSRAAFVRLSGRSGPPEVPPAGCVYVFHTSLCSTPEGEALCRGLEAGMSLRTLAEARVPARTSFTEFSYLGPDVPIAVLAR